MGTKNKASRYLYTCYPFTEIGDTSGKLVIPPRKVKLLSHDGDKYATVKVEGVECSLKWGYLSLTAEDAEKLKKNFVTLKWLQDNNIPEVD